MLDPDIAAMIGIPAPMPSLSPEIIPLIRATDDPIVAESQTRAVSTVAAAIEFAEAKLERAASL